MNDEFTSLKDLYLSLLPAFKVKERMIKKDKLDISNKDIWQYLKDNKWETSVGLTVSDMASDIINVKNEDILNYKEKKDE